MVTFSLTSFEFYYQRKYTKFVHWGCGLSTRRMDTDQVF